LISGDVHYSNIMRGDLARTRRRTPVYQFTMSPFRQQIEDGDAAKVKRIMTGDFSDFPKALQIARDLGIIYRPGFVDDQMRRIDWYPLTIDGSRADPKTADDFLYFRTLAGHLRLEGLRMTSRYDSAVAGGTNGVRLQPIEGGPFRAMTV
jgi:hypothetical protein